MNHKAPVYKDTGSMGRSELPIEGTARLYRDTAGSKQVE